MFLYQLSRICLNSYRGGKFALDEQQLCGFLASNRQPMSHYTCNTRDLVRTATFVVGYVCRAALATSMGPERYLMGAELYLSHLPDSDQAVVRTVAPG
jgi:hypothetical protein